MNCKYCRANCTGAKHDREIALCLGYDPPKTNGDFIRSMSDEELALFLEEVHMKLAAFFKRCQRNCLGEDCYECYLEWLKQEVE